MADPAALSSSRLSHLSWKAMERTRHLCFSETVSPLGNSALVGMQGEGTGVEAWMLPTAGCVAVNKSQMFSSVLCSHLGCANEQA